MKLTNMKQSIRLSVAAICLALTVPMSASASEGHGHALKDANIQMDHDTLRKGLEVFTNVCMGCHSAKYLRYGSLMAYPELGLTREEVDELRGEHSLMDGMVSELTPADAIESYGKVPPDLSLITRARRGAGNYVFSILTGYEEDPNGKIPEGNYNIYYPGNRIAMPDPLAWMGHSEDETAEIEGQAHAVASFLTFVGDPHQFERERIGVWVLGFLFLLAFVLWMLKREIWKDVKH
ncbi:MAG: cytochrome c1 [Zetaproteobacteria bacterium]|nr:cytochrome c1 [Zetaproteobacteria bacterium]